MVLPCHPNIIRKKMVWQGDLLFLFRDDGYGQKKKSYPINQ